MLAVATHPADWVVFVVAAVMVLAGGVGVVVARQPVHSALFLIQTLFGVAILFVSELAHFLAAVQVIVYAGAIVVLFLFVIMLLGVDRSDNVASEPLRGQRPMTLVLAVLGLAELALLVTSNHWATGAVSVSGPANGAGTNVEKLGRSLFSTYLLPFEVTSLLLVIAVVSAVVLTRRSHPTADEDVVAAEAEQADEEVTA
jgi:NADH-quinone oxidoreductase subunit J